MGWCEFVWCVLRDEHYGAFERGRRLLHVACILSHL